MMGVCEHIVDVNTSRTSKRAPTAHEAGQTSLLLSSSTRRPIFAVRVRLQWPRGMGLPKLPSTVDHLLVPPSLLKLHYFWSLGEVYILRVLPAQNKDIPDHNNGALCENIRG
jgi:hypothetical protein